MATLLRGLVTSTRVPSLWKKPFLAPSQVPTHGQAHLQSHCSHTAPLLQGSGPGLDKGMLGLLGEGMIAQPHHHCLASMCTCLEYFSFLMGQAALNHSCTVFVTSIVGQEKEVNNSWRALGSSCGRELAASLVPTRDSVSGRRKVGSIPLPSECCFLASSQSWQLSTQEE